LADDILELGAGDEDRQGPVLVGVAAVQSVSRSVWPTVSQALADNLWPFGTSTHHDGDVCWPMVQHFVCQWRGTDRLDASDLGFVLVLWDAGDIPSCVGSAQSWRRYWPMPMVVIRCITTDTTGACILQMQSYNAKAKILLHS
jgi:hypothetical protein